MQPDIHIIRFNMEILYLKGYIWKTLSPLLPGFHIILQVISSSWPCNNYAFWSSPHCLCQNHRNAISKQEKNWKAKAIGRELVSRGQWKDCGEHNGTPNHAGSVGPERQSLSLEDCLYLSRHPPCGPDRAHLFSFVNPVWGDQPHLEFQNSSFKLILSLSVCMWVSLSRAHAYVCVAGVCEGGVLSKPSLAFSNS